jgi:nucleoside-diphosphate-sugar epimerase
MGTAWGAHLPAAAPTNELDGYGDVGPVTGWNDALAGVDTVVHLAGLAHPLDAMAATAAIPSRVNAEGTARPPGCGRPACAAWPVSSALVHGEASPGRPFTEDDAPAPASPMRAEADRSGARGGGAGSPLQCDLARRWCTARAKGNFPRLAGLVRTGRRCRWAPPRLQNFIGIDNLAGCRVRCVEHANAASQVFLVGDAETTSTTDLIHRLAGALGRRMWTPHVPPALLRTAFRLAGRERDFRRLFCPLELDTSRIRSRLDWSPPVSLDEGLRRAVQ